ncbi:MAG: hypothetical protein VW800_06800 [Acidimicrobiaceae bacterium]
MNGTTRLLVSINALAFLASACGVSDDEATEAPPTMDGVETDRYCVEEFGTMNPLQYGDDPFLDDLHDACLGADGDACDTLWMATFGFEDAAYFDVAATCGGTEEFDVVRCGDIVPELTGDP